MKIASLQDYNEINYRFQLSWKLLSEHLENGSAIEHKSKKAIRKLQRCLKWCISYAFLHNYCKNIIRPYAPHPSLMIKRFWIDYWEQNFSSDIPPTAQDFFEWYCDSKNISEERNMLLLIDNKEDCEDIT